ncbi:hypothetical protein GCM10007390_14020 [Persicitalea jodogahamensis]|uniref:Uncharacterized protein n=1 Tax=Persicitalea jodogahamensis TaxID=402147 RepID=A0A8J3D2L1_9BACT|nr:hypothetical protein GCM10007390_14020 [Persicitalea jodogahamensis]
MLFWAGTQQDDAAQRIYVKKLFGFFGAHPGGARITGYSDASVRPERAILLVRLHY